MTRFIPRASSLAILQADHMDKTISEEMPWRVSQCHAMVMTQSLTSCLHESLRFVPHFPFKNCHGWTESPELVLGTGVCPLPRLPTFLTKATFLSTKPCFSSILNGEQPELSLVTTYWKCTHILFLLNAFFFFLT